MAQPMIQIDWLDGRITRFPEYNVGDAFGENIQPELEIRLEDLSDGIWIYLRHNEPIRPKQGVHQKQDPRGLACNVFADSFYQIATKEDVEQIAVLSYEGVPRLINDNGELINLSRLTALRSLYLGDGVGPVVDEIVAVAAALRAAGDPSAESNETLAQRLGIPVAYLNRVLQNLDDEELAADNDFS